MAIAGGFSGQRWHLLGDPFTDIWAAGTNDPDPEIGQAFLAAAGAYLSEHPTTAVEALLEHGISRYGATRALEDACNYDGHPFGAALGADEAGAVLQLVSRAGYDSYAVQEIVTGVATAHPQVVLDHLDAQADDGSQELDDIHELHTAYDARPAALASWIRSNLSNPHAHLVTAAAVNSHLTISQGDAFAELVADLDGDELLRFLAVLVDLETWALDQPALAEAITGRARETATHNQTRAEIKGAMRPTHWGTVDGVSEELNAALARAETAAEHAIDEDLKADYQDAVALLRARIDDERREQDEEDDSGW
jgi:hypothetical protein